MEDPDLNSQLEKDNYVILKKLTQYVNNKYYYYLLIKCKNESELEQAYNENVEKGYECKVLTF